jgi:hypothetical protein
LPTTTPTAAPTTAVVIVNVIAVAVAVAVVVLLVKILAVQPAIDVELTLMGHAVFANACSCAAAHEPDGVFDEFHWGAENGWGCV